MVIVKVEGLKLHALHGVYDGEPLVGGAFEVSLDVAYDDAGLRFDALTDTISYVTLLDIITARMNVPTPLLEKVASLILEDVFKTFPFIKNADISIFKLQAPIARFQGRVGVSLTRVY